MAPKDVAFASLCFFSFFGYVPQALSLKVSASLLVVLWLPFGSLWLPFGSLLAVFGSFPVRFGSLLVPLACFGHDECLPIASDIAVAT